MVRKGVHSNQAWARLHSRYSHVARPHLRDCSIHLPEALSSGLCSQGQLLQRPNAALPQPALSGALRRSVSQHTERWSPALAGAHLEKG